MFSLYLLEGGSPYIYFGGYEAGMVTGSPIWIPLSTANASNIGFWTLHTVSMQIEGHAPVTLGYDAVIDSGTTLMYVSSSTFTSIKA